MRRVVPPEVLRVSVDGSPSAVESNFRELDDAFLQTQTRIWLGEVLHIRFDEEMLIADLLADGELLFQVSKTVWKMLLKKYVDLKHSKVYIHEQTSFGKNKGRYMPYPKVDSFLKICQILGLTGIDMFSPSDVVEKRDTRRVCMCIRSLSKRARSKNLNVPDFDIVTYTIAMPTGMVGGIRRTLEQSQCSSSSSSGCSPCMDLRERYQQRSYSVHYDQHHDSYSESDEAESALNEFEFQSPLSNASDEASMLNMVGQFSPKGNSVGYLQSEFGLHSQDHTEGRHKSLHHRKTILSKSMDYSHTNDVRQGDHEFRMLRQLKLGCSKTSDSPISNLPYEELDGQHLIIAEEGYEGKNSSMLQDESVRNFLPKFSSTDLYKYSQNSVEELIRTSSDHDQIIHCIQNHENLGSECRPFIKQSPKSIHTFIYEIPDKEDGCKKVGECTEMACESIPMIKVAVDGLVIAETSSLPSLNISLDYLSKEASDKFDVHYTNALSPVSCEVSGPGEGEEDNHTFVTSINNKFEYSAEEQLMNTIEEEAMNSRIYDLYKIEMASGPSSFKQNDSSSQNDLSRSTRSTMESPTVYDFEMPVSCFTHVTKESHSCTRFEMDIDEQLSHSSVSMEHTDKDMLVDSVPSQESNTFSTANYLENKTTNDFESDLVKSQPVAGYCRSKTEGGAKEKSRQHDASREQHKDTLIEIEEHSGELCKEYSSNQYNVRENVSCTNISEFDFEEGTSSTSMTCNHIDKTIHGLEDEDMKVLVYLDTVVDVQEAEVKDIHVVHIEVPNHDFISNTVTTDDLVDHSSVSTQSQIEDTSMHAQKLLPCSTPTVATELKTLTGVKNLPLADDIRTGVECKETEANKNHEKNTEMIDEILVRTQNSSGKYAEGTMGEARRMPNKVLRSVAGGMAFVGTLFLLLHLRGRRSRTNISRTLGPSESDKSDQKDSIQKQVETGKSDGPLPVETPVNSQVSKGASDRTQVNNRKSSSLYPGERFKF